MAGFYPFNPNLGQTMQSLAADKSVDAAYIAHLIFSADEAVVADVDAVHAAISASADTAVVVTTGFTAPPCTRSITATAGGTAGSIKAVQVILEGTNDLDEVITETLPAFTADTAGSVEGSKAFKTITKVTVPSMDGAGVTVTIGFGEKLGIPFKLPTNTCLLGSKAAVIEATAPTITVSATAIEGNTIKFNSTLDGSVMHAFLIV